MKANAERYGAEVQCQMLTGSLESSVAVQRLRRLSRRQDGPPARHLPARQNGPALAASGRFRQRRGSAPRIPESGGYVAGPPAAGQLDVLSEEPPRAGNVLLDLDLPSLLLTYHVAWSGREAMQRLGDQLIDNIEAFVRGEERNRMV